MSKLVDRELELTKARSDFAEMGERVQESEHEQARAVKEAKQRVVNAEGRARELERQLSELQVELTEARQESGEGSSQAGRTLQGSGEWLAEATAEVQRLKQLVYDLQRSGAAEKEAMLQQSELSRYCALEEERRKWEESERRLCHDLVGLEEEYEPQGL